MNKSTDIEKKLQVLRNKKAELEEQKRAAESSCLEIVNQMSADALKGQPIQGSKLEETKNQIVALENAISLVDSEINKAESNLQAELEDEKYARHAERLKQADTLFVEAALDLKACMEKLKKVEGIRASSWKDGSTHGSKVVSCSIALDTQDRILKIVGIMQNYQPDIKPIYEELRAARKHIIGKTY